MMGEGIRSALFGSLSFGSFHFPTDLAPVSDGCCFFVAARTAVVDSCDCLVIAVGAVTRHVGIEDAD